MSHTDDQTEIFTIPVRRCKRCGGLLTSAKAIREGYGHTCKMKSIADMARKEADKNQVSFFDAASEEESEGDHEITE